MYKDEVNAKMQAEKAYYAAQQQGEVRGVAPSQPYYGDTCNNLGGCVQEYRPSPTEQAEKDANFHRDKSIKAEMAAAFFRANPSFDEFIRLIRSGVIGI